jgi:hypothetical protein
LLDKKLPVYEYAVPLSYIRPWASKSSTHSGITGVLVRTPPSTNGGQRLFGFSCHFPVSDVATRADLPNVRRQKRPFLRSCLLTENSRVFDRERSDIVR